ncbi:cysteine peptidase, Clan CA, family C2 [Strigomonas culicis]|uniref:Cysteine peptidase, Clan CA, family C2 n=2 Tax=Strigomonas culicis TaxID=28005 RepID=S9URF8_9TRYP|nr:cysteine peptidase, Clan CA, family C2 [Strigomonas culicis]|eukprot:EPY31483.1 cysteine peptidase, Clan CA, family C2 [Strigomonas culicis]
MGCCESKAVETKPTPARAQAPRAKPATPREVTPAKPVLDERAQRLEAIEQLHKKQFDRYHACDVEGGEVTPLFPDGLIYRIVKGNDWYIYNDTLTYEAHVDYRFGPNSQLTAGDESSLETTADGWLHAELVVYPFETKLLVSGAVDGFKSGVTVLPLSDEYLQREVERTHAVMAQELKDVEALADGETDEEEVLRRCIANGTPYVDLRFKPAEMLSREGVDKRELGPYGVQRPTQYLSRDEVRAGVKPFCGPVVPQAVNEGHLGDSWLTSAAAILAEREHSVQNVFAQGSDAERRVGAYRTTVSKEGWWRSVIVDDYVPTVAQHPVFASCLDYPRETWVPMLQKAYAKVHGSYAAVTGGDALQALQDLTGAPTYRFDKEWASAAQDADAAPRFLRKLAQYTGAGYIVIVNTPSQNSTSYLGQRYEGNADEMKDTYKRVGLRLGRTYAVGRVVEGNDGEVYFQIRNPWGDQENVPQKWLDAAKAVPAARGEEAREGFMWVKWSDALNYFDGGGVVYDTEKPSVDYRVKGVFTDVHPSAVLEIVAAEPVQVTLVLSQPDKRGADASNPNVRYAPIMLSVARPEDGRLRVEQNSAADPEAPSSEYNFMVARDVALTYTFRPEDGPYLVIPRIHRKGVEPGHSRGYTIGILSSSDLDNKLRVTAKQLDKDSRVFRNIITFPDEAHPAVEVETQVHYRGEAPVCGVSSLLVGAGVAVKPPSSRHSGSVQGSAEVASQEDEAPQEPEEEHIVEAPEERIEEPLEEQEAAPVEDEVVADRHDSDVESADRASQKA